MYVYIHLSIYAYVFNIFNIVTYITHHYLISFQVSTSQRGHKSSPSSILYLKYTKIKTSTTIKYKQNKQDKEGGRHATVSTIFKTTEGKKVDRDLKRNPALGFPWDGDPKHRTLLSSPELLKRESLRNSLNTSVKIHDLPETDDLTLFLIPKALKKVFLRNKSLTFGNQLRNHCQLNDTSVS